MKILALALMAFSLSAQAASVTVELAYRNAAAPHEGERRLVVLQGARDSDPSRFSATCGATGTLCECLLFRTSQDTNPLVGTGMAVSAQYNTLSCHVPGDSADAARYVQIRLREDKMPVTPLVAISTKLTLDDVLGKSLDKEHVRGIYRYSCQRMFFEGEGVGSASVNCVAGQHLGIITAPYTFYTYRSATDSNNSGGDFGFPADVCRRNDFLKIQCTGNAPSLEFGYYMESAGPFQVGVSMTRAPEAAEGDKQPLTANYGFAALPDSAGNCPIGLIKARPYQAQPASQIPRGPSCPADGCPSSFINSGNLNDVVVETAKPANFVVTRQPNLNPCSTLPTPGGDCTNATFQKPRVAQSVEYAPLTPILCVIPGELLKGLF